MLRTRLLALLLVAACSSSGGGLRTVLLTPVPGAQTGDLTARLKDAADLLQLRLNAVDHSHRSTVAVKAGRLVVRAPAAVADQVRRLGSPGALELRPVLEEKTGTKPCTVAPAAAPADAAHGGAACGQDGTTRFRVGPAAVVGSDVRSSRRETLAEQYVILVSFTPAGQRRFTALTRALFRLPEPRNQLAIVLDGTVVSAPVIQSEILGDAQISGGFTDSEAQAIAATIRYGGLPLAFAISEG